MVEREPGYTREKTNCDNKSSAQGSFIFHCYRLIEVISGMSSAEENWCSKTRQNASGERCNTSWAN